MDTIAYLLGLTILITLGMAVYIEYIRRQFSNTVTPTVAYFGGKRCILINGRWKECGE